MTDRTTEKKIFTVSVLMLVVLFVSCVFESQKGKIGDHFYYKGGVYFSQGNYENAEKAYKTAIYLQPKNIVFYGGLGAVYKETGNDKEYGITQSAAGTEGIHARTFRKWVQVHQNMVEYDTVCVSEKDNVYHFYNTENKLIRTDEYKDTISGIISLNSYSLYSYNENNQLIIKTDYNSKNEQKSVIEYAYDKNGRQISEIKNNGQQKIYSYYQDGQLVKAERYEKKYKDYEAALQEVVYYKDGQLIRLEKHNAVNGRLTDIYYYENEIKYKVENYLKDADTVYLSSYEIFDNEGNVTEEAYFNRDNTLRIRRKYTLKGSEGQKVYIKEEYYGPDDIIADRIEYIYDDKWNVVGFYCDYYDAEGNLEYSTKELPMGNRQITAFPRIEEINPRPLTETETEEVNRRLYLGKYEGRHMLDAFRCAKGVIDADLIMNYYADDICDMGVVSYKDTDEIEELKKEGLDLDYYLAEISSYSYNRISYSAADRFVRKMLGVGIEDSGLLQRNTYSEKYGCFYVMNHSYQENVVDFECIGGTLSENWLQLYDRNNTWIFRIDDGNYYPYAYISVNNSHMLPKETPKPTPSPAPTPEDILIQYKKKDVFLTPVAGMSREYNNAMTAFNREIEKLTEPYPEIYEDEIFQRIRYALMDITGNNIPELFVEWSDYGSSCTVYMYCDGSVKELEGNISNSTVMDSWIYEDGTVVTAYSNLGNFETICYRYNYDGTREQLLSYGMEWNYYSEEYDYLINEEKVTREKYTELIKTFLDENKKVAELDFEDVWYKVAE